MVRKQIVVSMYQVIRRITPLPLMTAMAKQVFGTDTYIISDYPDTIFHVRPDEQYKNNNHVLESLKKALKDET